MIIWAYEFKEIKHSTFGKRRKKQGKNIC